MIERSRTGVFCFNDGKLLAIELEDPTTRKRFWSLPGGAIEKNETIADAAIRETLEETGYRVVLTSNPFPTRYKFRWNAKIYDCTTHWFSADLASSSVQVVDDADYLLRASWLPWPGSDGLFANNPAYNEAFERFLPN